MSKAITEDQRFCFSIPVVIQSLSHVWLCDPWTTACQASLSFTKSQSLLKFMSIQSVMPSKYALSNASPPAFNLSQHQGLFQWVGSSHQVVKLLGLHLQHPSDEYSGLISFRIDWFDLLVAQGSLKNLLQHHSSKASFFGTLPSFSPTLTSVNDY